MAHHNHNHRHCKTTRSVFPRRLQAGISTIMEKRARHAAKNDKARVFFLDPRPQLKPESGCWCHDAEYPHVHSWRNCPNIADNFDIPENAVIKECPHGLIVPPERLCEHWFCFQMSQSAATYIDWFAQQNLPNLVDAAVKYPSEVQAVEQMIEENNYRLGFRIEPEDAEWIQKFTSTASVSTPMASPTPAAPPKMVGTPSPHTSSGRYAVNLKGNEMDAEANLLYQFVQTMRRDPTSSRHAAWVDEQRVRHILNWKHEPFENCLAELSHVMNSVKMEAYKTGTRPPPTLTMYTSDPSIPSGGSFLHDTP